MLNNRNILLVGCGEMGSALMQGWLENGFEPTKICVVEPSEHHAEKIAPLGVKVISNIGDIGVFVPSVIVFAVRPQFAKDVCEQYKQFAGTSLFMSIIAGKKIDFYKDILGADSKVIRIMPNLPALVKKSASAFCCSSEVGNDDKSFCESLMSGVGVAIEVQKEADIDIVTGLSGSGPAYVFYMVEAMAEAGAKLGLDANTAYELALNTIYGAGDFLKNSDKSASELRKMVATPNGTTEAGLSVLMADDGLAEVMYKTIAKASARATELGK